MAEVMTAREAFELGLKHYTGAPCPHGHTLRYVCNGACVTCSKEARNAWRRKDGNQAKEAARWRKRYPGKDKELQKRYYERHLDEVRERTRNAKRRIRLIDPEGERRRHLAWRERRENNLAEMAGGRRRPTNCDICGGDAGGIVFDHCHSSGSFRGWLCDRCNKTLGHVKDSPDILRAMAAYLEKSNGETYDEGAEKAA